MKKVLWCDWGHFQKGGLIVYYGKPIDPPPGIALILHKPLGTTCSHKEAGPLVYDLLPNLTLYGQYATAADPVGTNVFIVRAGENFDLATGAQWEVGIKQRLWNNRAEWTLAYFDIFRKNILTQTSLTTAQNVGRQTSKGVELSGAIRPTDAWRVQANLTLLSARFADFSETDGGTVVSRGGNRPPNVPETMANIWSVYRVPFVVPFDLGAAFRYVGHRYADNANAVRLNAYTTTDAWVSLPYNCLLYTSDAADE